MSKRKLKIEEIHEIGLTKSWDKAAIIFKTYGEGKVVREAVIRIPHPAVLRYIRERLDEIENAWKEMI